MTRVLWVTQHHPPRPGGMATSSDRITAGLRAAGHWTDVLHLAAGDGRADRRTTPAGTDLRQPVGDDPEHALRLAWLAVERLERPDVVCAFGGPLPLVAGPTFAAWTGARLVVLLRGNDVDTGIVSPRRRPMLLEALRAADAVTTVAEPTAAQVRAVVPDTPVHVVPNGIDLRDWELLPSDRAAAEAWRAAEVAPGAVVLAVIGQLKRKKGLDVLAAATRRLPRDRVHLLLVGDVAPDTKTWLEDPDAPPHTVVPFQERLALPRWYASADWLVVPSLYDGMPNVALEAAALGVPLVASDVGGLHDLLAAAPIGLPVAPGDPAALADALWTALQTEPTAREALGHDAAALVRERYGAEHETARYVEVLTGP